MRFRGDMNFQNYRYLYCLPPGSKYYPDGYYGCMLAVSVADARSSLGRTWKNLEIRRISVTEDSGPLADNGSQEYRKQLFDLAKKN